MGRKQRNEWRIEHYDLNPDQKAKVCELVEDGWNIEFRVGVQDDQGSTVFLSRVIGSERETCYVDPNGQMDDESD